MVKFAQALLVLLFAKHNCLFKAFVPKYMKSIFFNKTIKL